MYFLTKSLKFLALSICVFFIVIILINVKCQKSFAGINFIPIDEVEKDSNTLEKWFDKIGKSKRTYKNAIIDAKVKKEEGERVVVEETHVFAIPSSFKYVGSKNRNFLKRISGNESKINIYRNKNNKKEYLFVVRWKNAIVLYWYMLKGEEYYYNGRASYDADENFEQNFFDGTNISLCVILESYFPDKYKLNRCM